MHACGEQLRGFRARLTLALGLLLDARGPAAELLVREGAVVHGDLRFEGCPDGCWRVGVSKATTRDFSESC